MSVASALGMARSLMCIYRLGVMVLQRNASSNVYCEAMAVSLAR
ncbi:MAG: hypothetical protein ACJA09_003030 [Alcanivorax sp.]|jgi:hypothetical protein